MSTTPPQKTTTPLPEDLEGKLAEFLQSMSPLREVMASIADWQLNHNAEHDKLTVKLQETLDSHSFRIRNLEASAGRGWAGTLRTVAIILVAAGSGYAIRAISDPTASAVPGLSAPHR